MIPPSSFSREVPSPHKVLLSPIRSGRPSRQRQSKRTNLRLTSSSSSSCEDLSRCSEDSQETKLLSSFLEEITDPEPGKQLQQEKRRRSSSSIPIAAHYLEPGVRLQTVSWADQSGREEREDQREDRAKYFQHRVRTPYSFSLTDRQRLRERGMVVPSD